MRLLDTSGRRSGLTSSLRGELLTGGFASGRFAYNPKLVINLDGCWIGLGRSLAVGMHNSEVTTTNCDHDSNHSL